MDIKFVYKRFNFLVDQPDSNYSKKFDLDANITLVRGLQLTSKNRPMLLWRGSQKIEINGKEIFPEDYESHLLMSGIDSGQDNRFIIFKDGIEPGNREIKMLYKDETIGPYEFSPYPVSLILICDLKD